MKTLSLCIPAALLVGSTFGQARFVELATINLDVTSDINNSEFIGSNPSCVAWDGTDLYVGGYNNGSGTNVDVKIIRVQDALGAATLGVPFAPASAPILRGYIGLDISPDGIAAAFDSGLPDPNGITLWRPNGTQVWARNGRGGSGVAFDPGFPGGNASLGQGVAWTTFGSGRRALQNATNGADIWDDSDGMIIFTPEGTFWRDMDFDDDSGDIYLREGNNVIKWERTGDNSLANSALIFDEPGMADFTAGQNVAYLGGSFTDYVIYNDRFDSAPGQDFFATVTVISPDGSPVATDWGSFAPAPFSGWYDFSWDAASRTLAVLDFGARNVTIFSLDGGIGTRYCNANPNSTGVPAVIDAEGSAITADNSVTLFAGDLPQAAFGFFLASRVQGFTANPGGSAGNLCLAGQIGRYVGPGQIQNSGVQGQISLAINLTQVPQPTGPVAVMPGETWNFTCWFRDSVGGTATSNFADGVSIDFQ
ncbi:MAG: hypothetical protein AAF726_12335 [Planctomycetota bacterium]